MLFFLLFEDAYVYLKNPPPEFLPKIGVITIAGLAGVVLARKGRVVLLIFITGVLNK